MYSAMMFRPAAVLRLIIVIVLRDNLWHCTLIFGGPSRRELYSSVYGQSASVLMRILPNRVVGAARQISLKHLQLRLVAVIITFNIGLIVTAVGT